MRKKSTRSGKETKTSPKRKGESNEVKKGRKNNQSDKAKTKGAGKPKETPNVTKKTTKEGTSSKNKSFPIVGVGASAGGLEAFTQLLTSLPANTGMAFVLVQHMDPKHESRLTELLVKATEMPVTEVKDGMRTQPDHVYIIPSNTNMAIIQRFLQLTPRIEGRGMHMPIDYFFHSLAEDQGSKAIGVILSGNASDGTLGLKAIKAGGGITFAQDRKSAKYGSMPSSAVSAGVVDVVLPPEEIAGELARIGRHPYVSHLKEVKSAQEESEDEDGINNIFKLLRKASGVDLTYYKHTTIKRRIKRRMVLHRIEKLEDYISYLQQNQAEVESLCHDILISVTGFFRDPETFEALKNDIYPQIMKDRAPNEPIRIWVPGCSTGEEAYSIAMSLLEFLGKKAANIPIQIFGTDISEAAIEKARSGVFMESALSELSPERKKRFFTKVDGGYRISKTIREMCVFANQNVAKDPPFSKLDLISCRNVLIYLGSVLQKKIMPIFHYALKPSGFLMLGTSETIGTFYDMFSMVDRKHKIYAKKMIPARPAVDFSLTEYAAERTDIGKEVNEELRGAPDVKKESDRIVLAKYAPPGVVVNENIEIIQFRGHTGPYLEPAPGQASLNVLKMAREGLFLDLRAAIHKARKSETAVKQEGLQIKYNGDFKQVNIEVIPIITPSSKERFFLVLFHDVTPPAPESKETREKTRKAARIRKKDENAQITQLKDELSATREYLQAIIEEQEATNEELRSANEEILSSNEELQSTNEELETAKEELQSTNEELTTVNEELQNRNMELTQVTNDQINLLSSMHIPIVMLDNNLRLRRFTPMAEKVLNLIPTDIGRPLSDINLNINVPDLEHLILDVIGRVGITEREVQDHEGHWYSMRIRPYRTADNKIDGAVIVLVDIDQVKEAGAGLRRFATVVRDSNDAITVLDFDGHILAWNRGAEKLYGYTEAEALKMNIYDLSPESKQEEMDLFMKRLSRDEIVPSFETQRLTKDGQILDFWLTVTSLVDDSGKPIGIATTERDITERKRTQEKIVKSCDFYLRLFDDFPSPLWRAGTDAKCNYFNKSWLELTGRTLEQELGDGWTEDVHPEDLDRVLKTYHEAFKARKPFEREYRLRRWDGEYRLIITTGRPFHDVEGKFGGYIGSSYDITERRKMEGELLKTQKLESIGVLAGGIAHDLNNILSSIVGNISLVTNFSTLDDKTQRRLAEAERACHRIQSLIQQLLTFSKGGAPVKRISSIRALLKDSASLALSGSSIKCEYSIPGDLWPVEVDEGQLSQTINNLAINAREAMPGGGAVRISAENLEVEAGSESPPLKKGKYVKITIEDKGPGIPDEHIERIFDPFFTTKQGASGLGLTTAHSIIKNHDGHIIVESEQGAGTRFYFYIPASEQKSEKNSEEKVFRGKGKILVMDDEEMVRKLLREVLKDLGYSPQFAEEGREAIELYSKAKEARQPFDVVLLDLTVNSGMGGEEAMEKLKEIDPEVRALVSSGYSEDAVMAEYVKYGFKGVISKPYKIEELSAILYKVMNEG